ncbi:type II toxin-antitoxin system VapC family toxin [Candidatus Chloroploca asiatica]|uniref:Twitching motility protein PilT n=1 Tax=Candidatus Chloroploca asiatica TaxID=1506545 RepID=A0A2H3KX27_9CHLR|nr:type II toxin-antitoxin system VapC family toxin [Candidatus Chloroploca asiatica]PDV99960.1 twitching motility protein PilT [Candidatus Chloroploca asiatica]
MIILDTHIWVWWIHQDQQLPTGYEEYIRHHEAQGLGISAISCWEVAKLVEYGRLTLPMGIADWMQRALSYPGMRLLPLTPEIAIASTQLPPPFHRDPADQLIVATARTYDCPLVSLDGKIRTYPYVRTEPQSNSPADAAAGNIHASGQGSAGTAHDTHPVQPD